MIVPSLVVAALSAVPQDPVEPRVTHEFATVNGVQLHYARAGQGELILFLHGFPEFWYAWRRQLTEFGKDHLAVAPDLRGYNLSEKPAAVDQYRVPTLVEDVRALAARLSPGRPFVLVGHDWGGAVAWAFAIRHPDLLRKLIIVNAPHPAVFDRELRHNPAQQHASRYMLLFRSPDAESVLSADGYRAMLGLFSGLEKTGKFTQADRQAYLDAWSRAGALTGGLNYYRAARVGPPGEGTRDPVTVRADQDLTVGVRTLVIWGEQDTALLTGNLDGLDRFVPDLTVERIPNGSHWVVHEESDRLNRLMREFITR